MQITYRYKNDSDFKWDTLPFCHSDKARDKAIEILKTYDIFPVDTDEKLWKNDRDTLVLGIPDIARWSSLYDAPEWINEWTTDLMRLVFLLRPDKFDTQPAEYDGSVDWESEAAKNPIAYIIRMSWD